MSMGVDSLVRLRFHGIFCTGVICQVHQKGLVKVILGLYISRIGRVITIWDKLFLKIGVYFGGLVRRKKVLLESSHHIDTHIDVIVEVLEVEGSVAFELYLDEEFIEFW